MQLGPFRATHVPIGDDQLQHLELARELCRLFNKIYGETFPCPQPILGRIINAIIICFLTLLNNTTLQSILETFISQNHGQTLEKSSNDL